MSGTYIVQKFYKLPAGELQMYVLQTWTTGTNGIRQEQLRWVTDVNHATRFVDPNTAAGVVARVVTKYPNLQGHTKAVYTYSYPQDRIDGTKDKKADPVSDYDRAMKGI